MTIQERIDRARAELERQEAEEKAATPGPWSYRQRRDQSGYISNGAAEIGRRHGAWNTEAYPIDAACYVRARNLNPARLAVARGELEYAIERRDDLSASSADWNVSPDDKAAMLDEMFDGNGGLSIAECLLGLESAS